MITRRALVIAFCGAIAVYLCSRAAVAQGSPEPASVRLNLALELAAKGDFAKAAPILEELAKGGDPVAEYKLAEMYYRGLGVVQDLRRAAGLYEQAALQNVMHAQQNIAVMYLEGKGVQQDFERAVYWFSKAAAQGDAFAMLSLGLRYKNGEGVTKDLEQAFKWFMLAAERGLASAEDEVAMCYAQGLGVTQDFQQAVHWAQKAADQGVSRAMFNLGVAFARGTRRDAQEAYKWFYLCIQTADDHAGREGAIRALRAIEGSLSKAQIARAKEGARIWLVTHR